MQKFWAYCIVVPTLIHMLVNIISIFDNEFYDLCHAKQAMLEMVSILYDDALQYYPLQLSKAHILQLSEPLLDVLIRLHELKMTKTKANE